VTLATLIQRSLRYFWRTNLVIVFAIAVAVAVLTGSLLLGDSLTGSLRDNALARLGAIEQALVAPHFFRAELAHDLTRALACPNTRIVPAVLMRGAARNAGSDATIPNVSVIGVDAAFWQLFPAQPAPPVRDRAIALNATLARELGVQAGDALLLTLARGGSAPNDTLFMQRKRDKTVRVLRLTVGSILPDRGAGGFALDGSATTPRNLFIDRAWLLTEPGSAGWANALLVTHTPPTLASSLARTCTPEDYGLALRRHTKPDYLSVQSHSLLLSQAQAAAVRRAAQACHIAPAPTSIYLATRIGREHGPGELAYAIVAGLDDTRAFGLVSGNNAPLQADDLWLNAWAARDLGARVGERLRLTYLIPSPDGTYRSGNKSFTLRGIVAQTGPAADPGLVPEIAGITSVSRIDHWSAPFPIDLSRITPRDEDYWTQYRATPKAFISLPAARALWQSGPQGTRADWLTSIRLYPGDRHRLATRDRSSQSVRCLSPVNRQGLDELAGQFSKALQAALSPQAAGMVFRPVRQTALAAAQGTTDFGQLFLAMSFFIVLAAAGLAGVTMRLSVERRATEAGVLLATGCTAQRIRRALIGEGAILAVLGALLGIPLGLLYAGGLIGALASWWRDAVGGTALWLHYTPATLLIGGITGAVIGLLAVCWGVRELLRRSPLALLAGWRAQGTTPRPGRRQLTAYLLCALCLAALLLLGLSHGVLPATAAFFAGGGLLLLAGITASSLVLQRALIIRRHLTLPYLALRNAAVQRGRSLLTVGLLASASFILVTVAANQRDLSRMDPARRDSGTGGYTLLATSTLPLGYDLSSPTGRTGLGFTPADAVLFSGTTVIGLLASPGEDISCLNLARPSAPRLLGVPDELIERGGFRVLTQGKTLANPWTLLAHAPAAGGAIPTFADADSAMWSLHSELGGTFLRPGEHGTALPLRFTGLLPGSIFAGELLVSRANFQRCFPEVNAPRYFLIATPPGREQAVADALRRTLGDLGLEVRSTREVLAAYNAVPNTYLSMFLALGGLGMLLGTVGVLAIILRTALERRQEFALMLATGMAPDDLSALLILEHAGLLVAGVCCGTLAALVAVAPALASVESHVNWPALTGLLFAILALGLGTCALAAKWVTRGALLLALREE
jgi:ABC-type lipoprotein release transport system permease subunit